MIKRLPPIMRTIFVFAFLLSVCASTSLAQTSAQSSAKHEQKRIDRIMSPNADIEEFRAEMKNYLTDFANALSNFEAIPAMREQNKKSGIDPAIDLDRAIDNIDKMPAEDLARLKQAYSLYPDWRQGPRNIYEISQRLAGSASAQTRKGKNPGDYTTKVIITDPCPDISGVPSFADIAALKAFIVVNEGIIEAMPTDGLTIALRVTPVITYTAALTALNVAETLRAQYDLCTTPTTQEVRDIVGAAKTEVLSKIDASTTAIKLAISQSEARIILNDNNNKDAIILNDNNNKDTILAKIEAAKTYIVTDAHANKDEMKNLLLRTQIEADLASTDGSTFVALYQTPSSVCGTSLNDKGLPQLVTLPGAATVTIQQCGLLDLVRSIVRDTVANVGAGTNAQSFFATAEAHRTAGRYKQAYSSYRMAYKAASK